PPGRHTGSASSMSPTITGTSTATPSSVTPSRGRSGRKNKRRDHTGLSSWTARVSEPIRDPGTPASQGCMDPGSRASRAAAMTAGETDVLAVPLLACPHDARDPQPVGHREHALAVLGVERFELDGLGSAALELLRHHLARLGLDHDAVAAPGRRRRRDDEEVAVAIER